MSYDFRKCGDKCLRYNCAVMYLAAEELTGGDRVPEPIRTALDKGGCEAGIKAYRAMKGR